jgi:ligand-binding sensor domain-containing protein
LWIGTARGISCFNGVDWTIYNVLTGLPYASINNLIFDKQGNLLCINGELLILKYVGNKWTILDKPKIIAGDKIFSLAVDNLNNMWLGFLGEGVYKIDNNNWIHYDASNGLVFNTVSSIGIDSKDRLWFGTDSGVSKFDGSIRTNYTNINSGLIDNNVHKIVIDSEDNIWFATNKGVSKFDGKKWTTFISKGY